MHVYTRGLFEFLNKRQTARDISIEHPEWIEREGFESVIRFPEKARLYIDEDIIHA